MLQIISNGTMKREQYDKIFPFIDKLTISVDGYEEGVSYIRDQGIMPAIIETIEYCKSKVETTFVATLHKKNLFIQQRYYELAERLGIDFNFSLLTVDAHDEVFKDFIIKDEDFKKNIQLAHAINDKNEASTFQPCGLECRKSCGAGKRMVSVSADGSVHPCHMLHRKELCIGNMLQDDIEMILCSPKNLLRDFTVDNKKRCGQCTYKYLCGGGCNARAYLENGCFEDTDSTCVIAQTAMKGYFSQFEDKRL